jgi:hypothetical protein
VREGWAAVDAEAGDAEDGELDGEDVAGLAAWIVAGGFVGGGDCTVREDGGVEGGCFLCSFVVEEADSVFLVSWCAPGRLGNRTQNGQSYINWVWVLVAERTDQRQS